MRVVTHGRIIGASIRFVKKKKRIWCNGTCQCQESAIQQVFLNFLISCAAEISECQYNVFYVQYWTKANDGDAL